LKVKSAPFTTFLNGIISSQGRIFTRRIKGYALKGHIIIYEAENNPLSTRVKRVNHFEKVFERVIK